MAAKKPLVRDGGIIKQIGATDKLDGVLYDGDIKAGTNVSINNGTISATDTTYSAGTNVSIDASNKISASDANWSASVVTENQAKNKDDTTSYKWTPARVWYAIGQWFNGVTTAFTRGFLGKNDANACRDELGLGTAATKTVTTSALDYTEGRVLKVRDFGLGSTSGLLLSETDSLLDLPGGLYTIDTGHPDNPAGVSGTLLAIRRSSSVVSLLFQSAATNVSYIATTWQQTSGSIAWVKIYNSGNFFLNSTPASKTATGTKGDIRWDANYIYVCYDTNKWKRVAISDAGW